MEIKIKQDQKSVDEKEILEAAKRLREKMRELSTDSFFWREITRDVVIVCEAAESLICE